LRRCKQDVRAGKFLKELHNARILGSSEMVDKVLQGQEARLHQPPLQQEEPGGAILSQFERVVELSGLTKGELQGGSHRKSVVSWRHIFAALAVTRVGSEPSSSRGALGIDDFSGREGCG
jgi:hypothetical protein